MFTAMGVCILVGRTRFDVVEVVVVEEVEGGDLRFGGIVVGVDGEK